MRIALCIIVVALCTGCATTPKKEVHTFGTVKGFYDPFTGTERIEFSYSVDTRW